MEFKSDTRTRAPDAQRRQPVDKAPGPEPRQTSDVSTLQRWIGNRALGQWLRREGKSAPIGPRGDGAIAHVRARRVAPQAARTSVANSVQRFAGSEHEAIGDSTGATIDLGGGVVLTWGQVVALAGDQYGSVNELRDAVNTKEGKAKLRGRLMNAGLNDPIPAALDQGADQSKSEYLQLALVNISHFAGGGTAIETWRTHHQGAIEAAMQSGVSDDAKQWQDAQLIEAFGQHFLTDSFSAGHVRTPRAAIIDWYQKDFAPRAQRAFLNYVIAQLAVGLRDDLNEQLPGAGSIVAPVVQKIVDQLHGLLSSLIDQIFTPIFGLGIAGAVSGALHDRDNELGVWVRSEAHPVPWLAFGDDRLRCSPTSREQAELAVNVARNQLVEAQKLGRARRDYGGKKPPAKGKTSPGGVPGVVHFKFDSSAIDSPTASALDHAAQYLIANPERVVDIVGHTCPLGSNEYNYALGMRRAEAVAGYLMDHGVEPMRISSNSAGESKLVDHSVAGYPSDRRAELHYLAQGEKMQDTDWMGKVIEQHFGPTAYHEVEKYVPHEEPGANRPQADWHWGAMSKDMSDAVDKTLRGYGDQAKGGLADVDELKDRPIPLDVGPIHQTIVVHPRRIIEGALDRFLVRPTGKLGDLVGEKAGNRPDEPAPPAAPCEPAPAQK